MSTQQFPDEQFLPESKHSVALPNYAASVARRDLVRRVSKIVVPMTGIMGLGIGVFAQWLASIPH